MIPTGALPPLGATPDRDGTRFAVHSSRAERIELCLFDNSGRETTRLELPERSGDIWHGYVPGCAAGQRYGYRAHGHWAPDAGMRFNPAKLLLDPYARLLCGELRWSAAVFDFTADPRSGEWQINTADSADCVPRCVVVAAADKATTRRPRIPWSDMIIYEANVRGFTMHHPALTPTERGTFRGLRNGQILGHLKALGITAIELLPVQAFIDEQALQQRGLRNYWGYNSINFFAPANRYLGHEGIAAFTDMVAAIHEAGIEVILDVAYNHTGESDRVGPTLCYRGLDNLAYYRTQADSPGDYVNDTGCGNTLDADSPVVQQLVLDSLRYWYGNMGVDGFRFDLAPVLGRHRHGFSGSHPLLQAISKDAGLAGAKLIAEPWDIGPGGYQLGHFPSGWAEWNDRYRDSVRRFWRGDAAQTGELARHLHGSADIFEAQGRAPWAGINFITSHDGYTLADLVSYTQRHNEANGEHNRDGHKENFSTNHGSEGPVADAAIQQLRRQHRLNLLATLLFSQGTPMLLAGDELGNSQQGNNNAYAQDNELGWVDWSGLESDRDFYILCCEMVALRRANPLLHQVTYPHGRIRNADDQPDIAWYLANGQVVQIGRAHV